MIIYYVYTPENELKAKLTSLLEAATLINGRQGWRIEYVAGDLENVEVCVDGDYPKFVDSYIVSAFCPQLGRELTDQELDNISGDIVYQEVISYLY